MTNKNKKSRNDITLSWIVGIQPLLLIFQIIIIDVFGVPEETASVYRIILTSIPIIAGLLLCMKINPKEVIIVYGITLSILLINIMAFPNNEEPLIYDSCRFLLPVVIPILLCTTCISRISILWETLQKISWIICFMMLFYIYKLLTGSFEFAGYNMSLSYALLLPMLILYSTHSGKGVVASFFLFIVSVVIGSRGAAVAFFVFIVYDVVTKHKKLIVPFIGLIVLVISLLPFIIDMLSGIGLQSRTLELLVSNEFISHDSGRSELRSMIMPYIWENPLFGIGLWGDRVILGTYPHNIFIEILVQWGIIMGTSIILLLIYFVVKIYRYSSQNNRYYIVLFTIGTMIPLNASGSYLISFDLALYIGVLIIIYQSNKSSRFENQMRL